MFSKNRAARISMEGTLEIEAKHTDNIEDHQLPEYP